MTRQLFSFTNNPFPDNPLDLLDHTMKGLSAVRALFGRDDGDQLTEDESFGVALLLLGLVETLHTVETIVKERIADPYRAGYSKAFDLARGEYHRGVKEGQARLIARLEDSGREDLAAQLRAVLSKEA